MLFRAKRLKERDERKEGCIHIFLHLDAVDTIAGKKNRRNTLSSSSCCSLGINFTNILRAGFFVQKCLCAFKLGFVDFLAEKKLAKIYSESFTDLYKLTCFNLH